MADAVDSMTIFSGRRRHVVRLTNVSDGTGESAVAKVDISALVGPNGSAPTSTVVERIDYNIQGFSSVALYWDHTTDDEIAVLPAGTGCIDEWAAGGRHDPKSTGGTGDILLTTNGAAADATYDITLWLRLKD